MKPPIPHLSPLLSTALTLCVAVFANGEKYDYTAKNFSLLPPAPTVQHFFDFKDYPVNNFTGIPTISLPLYTIKHGGIEIPITLSYHGGGIRTNQKSGNAGLGWTISCGAEIAHNVCGAPDDATGKVHGLFHLNEDEKLFRNKLIEKNADYDPTDGDHYVNNFAWQAIQGNRYYEGLSDVGTDTYSLTGLGLSAVLWRDRTAHQKNSPQLTKEWNKFFQTRETPPTKEQIIKFKRDVELEYFGPEPVDGPNSKILHLIP